MQSIRRRLPQQIIRHDKIILRPIVLDGQLAQALRLLQGLLDAVDAAVKVVLGLVEDLLGLHDGEDVLLALEHLLGVEEFGQFGHVEGGGGALCGEEVGALGA